MLLRSFFENHQSTGLFSIQKKRRESSRDTHRPGIPTTQHKCSNQHICSKVLSHPADRQSEDKPYNTYSAH